ncbi:hypothetical protein PDR5_18580 [Pseudomonas sp. DR 5-09]|nr:hypothetical protein PDR5_18580 [Pseudomonas sp. DR 5-09]
MQLFVHGHSSREERRRIDRDCNTAQWVAGKYRVKNSAIVHNGRWQHDCTAVCDFGCIATLRYV